MEYVESNAPNVDRDLAGPTAHHRDALANLAASLDTVARRERPTDR